ncbi:MAG: class II aldolase/adducin family protein [Ilumatobacteraceae bacterium]|nr:class II aldolase/adducin family protein [Ilumatobacteraceae bacterium]
MRHRIAEPVIGRRRLPELRPELEFALLARALHRAGYDDEGLGHFVYRQPGGTLLANPFECGWDELTPADVMRIDLDGNVLAGDWTVSPATRLHLELLARRDDVIVSIHNHPRWATVWADAKLVPPIFDQTGATVGDDLVLLDEYTGSVDQPINASAAVDALDDASSMLLANHGVLVTGASVQEAHLRAVTLEWRCRRAWEVRSIAPDAEPLAADTVEYVRREVASGRRTPAWEFAVRRELRLDPALSPSDVDGC